MRPNPAVAGRCAIRPRNAGDFYGLGVSIVKTQLSNQQSITLNPISHAALVCYELEVLTAFEKGQLKSVATKAELAKFKAVARATSIKDRRVNIRLSSGDLSDIQVKGLEEGVPYQTLIASVLHKYVTGRLAEPPAAKQTRSVATKRRTPSNS
jgi:predicted DNA binding CopG/RHH family protein